MMNDEQQAKLDVIHRKVTSPEYPPEQDHWKHDLLWLLQLVEVLDTQIEMLTAPEHVRGLMRRFNKLTPTRKGLILELMREMQGELNAHAAPQ